MFLTLSSLPYSHCALFRVEVKNKQKRRKEKDTEKVTHTKKEKQKVRNIERMIERRMLKREKNFKNIILKERRKV